jgi:uncharacterized membrane protein YeiH
MTPSVSELLVVDPFAVMNTVGLVAFALVGAAKAVREHFDIFGVAVVGLATAFAGGTTRDLLVDRVPLVLQAPVELGLGLLGVCLALALTATRDAPDELRVTLLADAVGLAAFTTSGAIVATQTGVSWVGVVVVATVNAVGGGALADILLDRAPFILLDDFYASCAVLGASAYVLADGAGLAGGAAAAACAGVVVGTRVAALVLGWELPTAQRLGLAEE